MNTMLIVGSVVGVVILAVVIWLIISALYRVVVPTNMVHIVNSSKGRTTYGKDSEQGNTYHAFPTWIPFIGVSVTEFPISNFGINLKDYSAYDHKRLPFSVDIQAFFVMEDASVVSQRVSNYEELQDHLKKIVSGAVRKVCAGRPLEEILSSRASLAADFDVEVVQQLKDWGVKPVNSIEFMNIQDTEGSKVIRDIQTKEESRIDLESREAKANNNRAAETKEIEAQRQIELARQEAQQQIGTRTAEKERAVGISNEQAKQQIAEQARITTERNMEVKSVEDNRKAQIAKEVAETNALASKQVDITNAEAEKQKQVLEAEAQLEMDIKAAEGIKAKEIANATGIKAVGEAKATAEKEMQLASVTAQTTLAKEIGGDQGYQNYLVSIKQVEVNGEVGKAQAIALEKANINIVSGSGTNAGVSLAGVLQGFGSTELGQQVISAVTKHKKED